MARDLTSSEIDRKNILNNMFAVEEIKKATGIKGVIFEDRLRFTKEMVSEFFEVDIRTISRYLEQNTEEFSNSGYEVLKGRRVKEFIKNLEDSFGKDINVSTKITILGVFDFKSFLNLAMLLKESENARVLRQTILDIVIDVVNQKTGGATKYINQRDEEFLGAFIQQESYRKQFTNALKDYVEMNKFKYALYTDKIYQSIFREKSKEYRTVLNLKEKEKIRDTFYSEVLDLVASYECGLAEMIKQEAEMKGRKLNNWEVNELFKAFEELPHWKPLLVSVRTKMASRDLAFRDALHLQLEQYVKPLNEDEYNRFLGDKSKELDERLIEAHDALKRLKERD